MLVVSFPTMLLFVIELVVVFLLVMLLFAIISPLVQAQSTTTISGVPKIGGQTDYSNWTFTYTRNYHLITEGTNELTSKIFCFSRAGSANNLTKYYSVNVTGSSNPSLTRPTKFFSSSNGTGNSTYIEITAEYSNSNKHDNNNPKIEIRSSSSMISTNGKLKTGENTNLEQRHFDLNKSIHGIIKKRIDKILGD
jgi:hypothetical protein